ncbi:hypothetical protein ACWIB8_01170 [Corynebacterium flavescens]
MKNGGTSSPGQGKETSRSADAKSNQELAVKERHQRLTFSLSDAQWLRAQRGLVVQSTELEPFQQKVAEGIAGYKNSTGISLGMAIVVTILTISLALVGVALGLFVMNAAGDWITSLRGN